ncbi:MAG: RibD family protein, partial [Nitrospirota bacterium]|nr:RibD family protein [Nitrospirota bacterium]
MKTAMTLDGKIATASGESKWITGPKAREHVHHLRSQVDAILVGINTVLKDNPQLTVRVGKQKTIANTVRQPVRVVMDSRLRTPIAAGIFQETHRFPTLIFTTHQATSKKIEQCRAKGAEVIVLPQKGKLVSISACLKLLGKKGITSVMVEGGSEINASFIRCGFVNRLMLYIAPAVLGGQEAIGWLGGT